MYIFCFRVINVSQSSSFKVEFHKAAVPLHLFVSTIPLKLTIIKEHNAIKMLYILPYQ